MSGLNNLTARILKDAEDEAARIVAQARGEADAKIARDAALAESESEKIIADAKIEAERTAEQLVWGKTLAVRDETLAAKRQMLDKLFAEALNRLNGMSKDEFVKFLAERLSKLELNGEELVVPTRYGIKSVEEIGANLNLKLCADESRDIDGGFVLINKGIEQNNTFESLIGYYRDELEGEALRILYAE